MVSLTCDLLGFKNILFYDLYCDKMTIFLNGPSNHKKLFEVKEYAHILPKFK